MFKTLKNNFLGIVVVFSMTMLFFSCQDNYERVGEEAKKKIYPRGIAENFVLTYSKLGEPLKGDGTESSKNLAILRSSISYDYSNLIFPYRTFPKKLEVDIFDENGKKNTIRADYAIIYSATDLIDLQGNVVIVGQDGKKLETTQLYYDQANEWIFTQEKFKFTNPEDGTIMDGEGMDFQKDLTFLNAHRTYGFMMIKDKLDD